MLETKSTQMHSSSRLEMLIHGEGAAVSASIINTVKYYTEDLPFKNWQTNFNVGLNSMKSEDLLHEAEFQSQFDSISDQYGGIKEEIIESSEYKDLINRIRGTGVPRRWDYERFIYENTSEDVHGSILGYYDSNGEYNNWTDSDYEQMSAGNRIIVEPGENIGKRFIIEGHHGRSISQTSYDDMTSMFDPDNIRLSTPKGHLQHGHEGNWQTSGNEPYTEVTDRVNAVTEAERRHINDSSNHDEMLAIVFGMIGGSISAILKYIQLSKDPMPWNRRKYLSLAGAFASGAATGSIPFIVILAIKDPLGEIIESGIEEIFNNGQSLAEDSMLDNLAEASGEFSLIMGAILVRTFIQSGAQYSQYGYKAATGNFVHTIKRASSEQAVFVGIRLILDAVIPDPTFIVTGIRVIWSIFKIKMSIEHRKRLVQRRLDSFRDVAFAAITS